MMRFLNILIIYMAAHSLALAQVVDATEENQAKDEPDPQTFYSERARLGNQRTQTEAEVKAREERLRFEEAERQRLQLEQAERERQRAQESAGRREESVNQSSVTTPGDADRSLDLSRTLEQLRTLGELKDDGYITEEEFSKIKRRILDSQEKCQTLARSGFFLVG